MDLVLTQDKWSRKEDKRGIEASDPSPKVKSVLGLKLVTLKNNKSMYPFCKAFKTYCVLR